MILTVEMAVVSRARREPPRTCAEDLSVCGRCNLELVPHLSHPFIYAGVHRFDNIWNLAHDSLETN